VIYHGLILVKQSIRILMEAVPTHISISEIKTDIENIEHVEQAIDIHIFQLNEHKIFLEGKISFLAQVPQDPLLEIKNMLDEKHGIKHSTLEVFQASSAESVFSCYEV